MIYNVKLFNINCNILGSLILYAIDNYATFEKAGYQLNILQLINL